MIPYDTSKSQTWCVMKMTCFHLDWLCFPTWNSLMVSLPQLFKLKAEAPVFLQFLVWSVTHWLSWSSWIWCVVYWHHLKRLLGISNWPNCLVKLKQRHLSFMKHSSKCWRDNLSFSIRKKNVISVVLSLTAPWHYERCRALRLCQMKWSHWGDTSLRLTRQLSSATMTFWQKT